MSDRTLAEESAVRGTLLACVAVILLRHPDGLDSDGVATLLDVLRVGGYALGVRDVPKTTTEAVLRSKGRGE